jgi:hypothetical protein
MKLASLDHIDGRADDRASRTNAIQRVFQMIAHLAASLI